MIHRPGKMLSGIAAMLVVLLMVVSPSLAPLAGAPSGSRGADLRSFATPTAPTGVFLNYNFSNVIYIYWSHVIVSPTVSTYDVFQASYSGSCGTYSKIGNAAVSGPYAQQFNATGLAPLTTYCFKVSAYNGAWGPNSTAIRGTTLGGGPTQVMGFTAVTYNSTAITLNWIDQAGISFYTEYEGSTCGALANTRSVADNYSAMWTGLTPLTTYCFAVSATNGNGTGATSTPATATTARAAPGPVTGLTYKNLTAYPLPSGYTAYRVTLLWTASSTATTYWITSGCVFTNQTLGATSYLVTNLPTSTKCQFAVAAANSGGNSSVLAFENVTTLGSLPLTVSSVSVLTQTNFASQPISWTAPTYASGYVIYWGLSCYGLTSNATSATNYYIITGLAASTYYCVEVAGTNTVGQGANSTPATFTSLPLPPGQVQGLDIIGFGQTWVYLSWNLIGSATEYTVVGFNAACSSSVGSDTTIATDYNFTGLTNDTRYCFEVYAVNAGGSGNYSSPVLITTGVGDCVGCSGGAGLLTSTDYIILGVVIILVVSLVAVAAYMRSPHRHR